MRNVAKKKLLKEMKGSKAGSGSQTFGQGRGRRGRQMSECSGAGNLKGLVSRACGLP